MSATHHFCRSATALAYVLQERMLRLVEVLVEVRRARDLLRTGRPEDVLIAQAILSMLLEDR